MPSPGPKTNGGTRLTMDDLLRLFGDLQEGRKYTAPDGSTVAYADAPAPPPATTGRSGPVALDPPPMRRVPRPEPTPIEAAVDETEQHALRTGRDLARRHLPSQARRAIDALFGFLGGR